MDLTPTQTPTTTSATDNDGTPPHTLLQQQIKPLTYTNDTTLQKHHYHHHYPPSSSYHLQQPPYAVEAVVVFYKECLKNHAVTLGGHALDGCGEFMPSPENPDNPASLKCAACGCHRNFHRRETNSTNEYYYHHYSPEPNNAVVPHLIDFRRLNGKSSPSPSPPETAAQSNHHPLLALSSAALEDKKQGLIKNQNQNQTQTQNHHQVVATPVTPKAAKVENPSGGRKRFRTKFSREQKEKMHYFAEKLGWKMQRSSGDNDPKMVENFCNEIGVSRGVLKVWMHNNKSKKEMAGDGGGNGGASVSIKNEENSITNGGSGSHNHAFNTNNGLSSSSPSTS